MNRFRKYASILTIFTMAGLLPLATVGCQRGPGERAGARVDRAAEDTRDWTRDAADDVGDWTEDRADDVEDAWNDATD